VGSYPFLYDIYLHSFVKIKVANTELMNIYRYKQNDTQTVGNQRKTYCEIC